MEHRDVPYLIYEATQARNERTIKRLIVVVIIAIALMFVSNAIWLWAWNSYDYVGEETAYSFQQDSKGLNNINMGSQGDINNEPTFDDSETDQN